MRISAGLLILVGVLLLAAGLGSAALSPQPVYLDDASLGAVQIERGSNQPPLVALEPVAAALGWHVARLTNGARLEGNDRSVALTIGSRGIRENGDLRIIFSEPLVDRGGKLYLAAPDIAKLFGLQVSHTGTLAFHRPAQLSSDATISEIPRPATPHPAPTPRPVRRDGGDGYAGIANAGRVMLSLDRVGTNHMFGISSQTQGAYLKTSLTSTGIDNIGTPQATVVMGTPQHHVTAGLMTDPLSGLIFQGGVYQGVDLYRGDVRRDQFFGRRLDSGLASIGEVYNLPDRGGADTIAVLGHGGSYYETILRRFRVTHQPWGDFAREFIIGDKGAAVGLSARTKGRTYVESTVTYATKGLPLGPNDAPISIDVGRHLSDNTTVVGGFYATPQQPWGPFAGISTHSRNFSLGITASAHNVSAGFAYQSQRADVSFYTVPGVERAVGFNGVLYMPGSQLEAQSSNSSGTNDASLTLRTIRPGLNFIGGISVPSGGKPGPVAGVSIPLGHLLAVETTLRPSSSGPYGLHVGLAMGIAARRPPSAPTIPARISIDGAMPLPKMRLFVDGAPLSTFAAASATANVERGTHTFAVESVDGALGSQDVALNVQAAGDSVNLTLWPERTVRGRIVVDNSASVPTDFTLAHIIVVIQPGDISVESAQDGTFFFPRQPIAPVSTIRVDAGSLPRELRPSDPLPLDGTDVELRLLPGLRIERQSFPSR